MTRTTPGNKVIKKRKKLFKQTKTFYGSQSKLYRISTQRFMKSKTYSFSDRRKKKQVNRKLWINRINGKLKNENIKYSKFIHKIKKKNILLNRKVISKLVIIDPTAFKKIISKI